MFTQTLLGARPSREVLREEYGRWTKGRSLRDSTFSLGVKQGAGGAQAHEVLFPRYYEVRKEEGSEDRDLAADVSGCFRRIFGTIHLTKAQCHGSPLSGRRSRVLGARRPWRGIP